MSSKRQIRIAGTTENLSPPVAIQELLTAWKSTEVVQQKVKSDLTIATHRLTVVFMRERIAFKRHLRLIKMALLGNWLEIIVAAVLLIYSLKLFLMFWFLQHITSNAIRTDYLRGLGRVFQVCNEKKLIVIMRHLKITDEEGSKILNEEMSKLSKEQLDLWKDYEEEATVYGL